MNATVSISFIAQDVDSLCAALDALQARGIAPAVNVAPPAPRPPASVGKPVGQSEPSVDAYLAARQAHGFPATIFRVWKSEKVRGLSREQAAQERMMVPGWESAQGPQGEQGEQVNAPDTETPDDTLPADYQAF